MPATHVSYFSEFLQQHEKAASFRDAAAEALGNAAQRAGAWAGRQWDKTKLPQELAETPDKLTGVKRFQQLLHGNRLDSLVGQYSNMPAGPDKEKFLRSLTEEDKNVLLTRLGLAGAGIGAMSMAGQAAQKGQEVAMPAIMRAVGGKFDERSPEEKAKDDQASKRERVRNMISGMGLDPDTEVGGDVLERMMLSSKETDKYTSDDLVAALNAPIGIAAGAIPAYLATRPAMERIVGAQSFYHGTNPRAAESILQTGLDPSYGGGDEGFAAKLKQQRADYDRKMAPILSGDFGEDVANRARELAAKGERITKSDLAPLVSALSPDVSATEWLKLRERLSAQLEGTGVTPPTVPLVGSASRMERFTGEGEPAVRVPVDTTNFVNNAKGRLYTGPGELGLGIGAAYAYNPETGGEGLLNKYTKHFTDVAEEIKKRNANFDPYSATGVYRTVYPAMWRTAKEVVNPAEGHTYVVGGVLPYEQYHAITEADPDDVTPFQIGRRTRLQEELPAGLSTKVAPENLERGAVSAKNIWKNRSKNWFQYAKNNPGRVATGLGIAGLGYAPIATQVAQTIPTIKKVYHHIRGQTPIADAQAAAQPTPQPAPQG